MNRFLRQRNPGFADYVGLMVFAVVYLVAMGFVVSPGAFVDPKTDRAASYLNE